MDLQVLMKWRGIFLLVVRRENLAKPWVFCDREARWEDVGFREVTVGDEPSIDGWTLQSARKECSLAEMLFRWSGHNLGEDSRISDSLSSFIMSKYFPKQKKVN